MHAYHGASTVYGAPGRANSEGNRLKSTCVPSLPAAGEVWVRSLPDHVDGHKQAAATNTRASREGAEDEDERR